MAHLEQLLVLENPWISKQEGIVAEFNSMENIPQLSHKGEV